MDQEKIPSFCNLALSKYPESGYQKKVVSTLPYSRRMDIRRKREIVCRAAPWTINVHFFCRYGKIENMQRLL